MKKDRLKIEIIRSYLEYDATEGRFYWKMRVGKNVKAGMEAGVNATGNGYRYISIGGVAFPVQRLAWFMSYGVEPVGKITFKDGDKTNVRLENLVLNRGINGYDSKTPEGRALYQKAYRAQNRERFRHDERFRKYGLSASEYEALFEAQSGRCAICKCEETATRLGNPISLAVDHHHKTGRVRELLCTACNKMIGLANEKPEILVAAIRFLKKHSADLNVIPIQKSA